MAFNPSAYKAPTAKHLPVILLLDVSGSMYGDRINSLNDAVVEMIKTFADGATRELIIDIAVITFGSQVKLHTPYTPVVTLQQQGWNQLNAEGMTPMGMALKMAKDMIEDKDTTPSNIYKPAVVLVSDGGPNDNWQGPLQDFINNGRSAKCQRFGIPIGNGADISVIKMFTGTDENIFYADDAKDIVKAFKTVTMSVSMRSKSQNPNDINIPSNVTFDNNTANDDDDDDRY